MYVYRHINTMNRKKFIILTETTHLKTTFLINCQWKNDLFSPRLNKQKNNLTMRKYLFNITIKLKINARIQTSTCQLFI